MQTNADMVVCCVIRIRLSDVISFTKFVASTNIPDSSSVYTTSVPSALNEQRKGHKFVLYYLLAKC